MQKNNTDSELLHKAVALHRSGNLREAESAYQQLITANPFHEHALSLLGTVYAQQGNYADAIELMNRALAINPLLSETYFNRGLARQLLGNYHEALANYRKAADVEPGYAEAYWHQSLILLTLGQYVEGWKLFEWRWNREGKGPFLPHQKMLSLDASLLKDKTIALHVEQGMGDTLQFCRYIHLLTKNNEVVFLCPAPFLSLMRYNFPTIKLVELPEHEGHIIELPACDYHINMMSLPMVFGTTVDTIPYGSKADDFIYLQAEPDYLTKWEQLLRPLKSKASPSPLIGLCWAGGQRPDNPDAASADARRSLRFEQLKPLIDSVDATFISLQLGLPAAELNDDRVKNVSSEIESWSDTAALIAQLDYVVTVDTSVCHMAAAMGKKTLLLNRYDTCWRWLLERNDSPWYPSLTQFRQTVPGKWEDVVKTFVDSLRADYRAAD